MVILNQSWEKYLRLIFILLATGLFSSGVVTFIAANWDFLTKFQKLYGTQFLLVLVILFAIVMYWQESQQQRNVKSNALFFVSMIVIGALLALIGQIYQTGADPWQLFAIWTLLQLPLLLYFPHIARALLFLVTLNIALIRYQFVRDVFWSNANIIFTIITINLCLVGIIEYTKKWLNDPWFIVSKVQNTILLGVLVLFSLWNKELVPITWGISLGLLWFYKKQRLDFFNLALHFAYLIGSFDFWLLAQLDHSGFILAIPVTLFALFFVAYQVKSLGKMHFSSNQSQLAIQLLYLFLVILGALVIVAYLFLVVHSELYSLLLIAGLISAVAIVFRRDGRYLDLSYACFLMALWLWIWFWAASEMSLWLKLTMSIMASVLVYLVNAALWLKTAIVFQILMLLFSYLGNMVLGYREDEIPTNIFLFFSQYAYYWLPFTTLLGFYWLDRTRFELRPLAWGFLLFYLDFALLQALFIDSIFETEGGLPVINSVIDFIHLITFNLFIEKWTFETVLHFGVQILPLVFFFILYREKKNLTYWLIAIWILLFSLMFISNALLAFCFCLLLFTYEKQNMKLFVLCILVIILSLGQYYYALRLPLLYKSYLLLLAGGIFAIISIILFYQDREPREIVQNKGFRYLKRIPVAALATLLFTLSITNWAIKQNEDVLENGEAIVLTLAPIDPRSLMQGDYMALNYELIQLMDNKLDRNKVNGTKVYALLTFDHDRVAQFCRFEYFQPQDYTGCAEGIYLPIRVDAYGQLFLPSHEYFFPEGKASYYERAKYGEYRFRGGKILLARLLDKDRHPL
ncbi:GDYXXLXY domain-containing protein [Actinobacillus minor]|uniref:GDYXXLXY domain-containing protein n=1 Tax=Actinobacillus minor TaxID=51047 RepID=UPI0026F0DD1D|nr:GDYXXLXY domain-containing protein [Actinobacillus minor]